MDRVSAGCRGSIPGKHLGVPYCIIDSLHDRMGLTEKGSLAGHPFPAKALSARLSELVPARLATSHFTTETQSSTAAAAAS